MCRSRACKPLCCGTLSPHYKRYRHLLCSCPRRPGNSKRVGPLHLLCSCPRQAPPGIHGPQLLPLFCDLGAVAKTGLRLRTLHGKPRLMANKHHRSHGALPPWTRLQQRLRSHLRRQRRPKKRARRHEWWNSSTSSPGSVPRHLHTEAK